jgi:hypothetical protein
MTRYADGSYDVVPGIDRLIDGRMEDDGSLPMVRDVELGNRASEMLDMLEDRHEVVYWADLAVTRAMGEAG